MNPQDEEFLQLVWQGPFSYGPNGLAASLLDRFGPQENELEPFMGKPGLYIVLGDHPLHGSRSLMYIGRTNSFGRRFREHHSWVKEEWRVEVYLAIIEDPVLLSEVESLFIYAHVPHYNLAAKPITPRKPLRVWNSGRYWKLFPEVSSSHMWYVE